MPQPDGPEALAGLRLFMEAHAAQAEGMIVVDARGRPVFGPAPASPLQAVAGRLAEPPISYRGERPVPPEEALIRRALHGETAVELLAVVGPDGSRSCLAASAGPIRDARGQIIGAVSTLRDVTAQLFAGGPVGVPIQDAQGQIKLRVGLDGESDRT